MSGEANTQSVLLIFDLDGTIYNTESSFLPSMRAVYDKYGVPYVGDRAVMSMVGETHATFLKWLQGQDFPVGIEALGEAIAALEVDAIDTHGRLYDGVAETLPRLRQSGYKLAICTNGGQPYTQKILGKFGLIDVFDAIKTHGDADETKTEMIRILLDRFQPRHAFMVGDRYHDFVAGAATGCTVIAARYGFADQGEADEVDASFSHFRDLPKIVADLGAPK